MPFFSKSLAALGWSDIRELFESKASETVRLEFKEGVPDRDQFTKKVCAFANTYGGYILMGASEKDGDLAAIPGVPLQSSLDQQIVQWCFEQLYPPVVPLLSPPIPVEGSPDRFVYVVFVEESAEAPHFVNKRKGCYVRTDEFSQRFEPKLATLPELEHLLQRRERAVRRRQALLARAEERASVHLLQAQGTQGPVEALPRLTIAAIPRHPGNWLSDMEALRLVAQRSRIAARSIQFPDGSFDSQARGFYFLSPRRLSPSYLELDAEGLIFYRAVLEPEVLSERSGTPCLDLREAFAWLIFYLRYFGNAFGAIGFNGTLSLSVALNGIRGRRISAPWTEPPDIEIASPRLDDKIEVGMEATVTELSNERIALLRRLYRELAFASGWRETYWLKDDDIDAWIRRSCKRLYWNTIDG